MQDGSEVFYAIIFLLAGILYIFPTLLASHRSIKGVGGVFVVNFFLGWTFIGWVVALAWAAGGERTIRAPLVNVMDPLRQLTPDEQELALMLLARAKEGSAHPDL